MISPLNNGDGAFRTHPTPQPSDLPSDLPPTLRTEPNRRLALAFTVIMETSVRCASHQWLLAGEARETSAAAAGSQSVFIRCAHVYDKNCEKGQGFTINHWRPPYRASVPITQWNNEFVFRLEIQYRNYCKDKQPTNDWLLSCFQWSGTGAVVVVPESLNYKLSSFAYNASWSHSVAFLSCM